MPDELNDNQTPPPRFQRNSAQSCAQTQLKTDSLEPGSLENKNDNEERPSLKNHRPLSSATTIGINSIALSSGAAYNPPAHGVHNVQRPSTPTPKMPEKGEHAPLTSNHVTREKLHPQSAAIPSEAQHQTIVYVQSGTSHPSQAAPPPAHPQQPNMIHAVYQPLVPYVATHPQDPSQPYLHSGAPHWSTPASSLAWVPPPHEGRATTMHGQQPGYPHPLQPAVLPGMQPVTYAQPQYAAIPGPMWAPIAHHPGHTPYPGAIPIAGHSVTHTHGQYVHYYPPAHIASVPEKTAERAKPATYQNPGSASQKPIDTGKPSTTNDASPKPETVNGNGASAVHHITTNGTGTSQQRDAAAQNVEQKSKPPESAAPASNPPNSNRNDVEHVTGNGNGKSHAQESEKETGSAVDTPIRKARKPYTITKHRELWTTQEHQLFLQALRLYNRDWKRIEAHIGTKTVLQIRSHAQKHFSKVTKYNTGEYIPPPRPKRKATRPYPRSRPALPSKTQPPKNEQTNGASNSKTVSDSGNGSSDNGAGSGSASASGSGSGKIGENGSGILKTTSEPGIPALKPGSSGELPVAVSGIQTPNASSGYATIHRIPKSVTRQPTAPLPTFARGYTPHAYPGAGTAPGYPPGYYANTYSYPPAPGQIQSPLPRTYVSCYDPQYNAHQAYPTAPHFHFTHPSSHAPPAPVPAYQPPSSSGAQYSIPPPVLSTKQSNVPNPPALTQANPRPSSCDETAPPQNGPDHPLTILSNCAENTENNEVEPVADAPNRPKTAVERRRRRARIIRERKTRAPSNHEMNVDKQRTSSSRGPQPLHNRVLVLGHPVKHDEGHKHASSAPVEKTAALSTLLNAQSEEPRVSKAAIDVLVGSNNPANSAMVDEGSDEAVAGFSDSYSQGSPTNGMPGEGQERSRSPEDDPGSSEEDRRRQTTRDSTPTEPNSGCSAGSREDTPSGQDSNGSRNDSPPSGGTPLGESRETTPSDNGETGLGNNSGGQFDKSGGGGGKQSGSFRPSSSKTEKADATLQDAAKALTKYRNATTAGGGNEKDVGGGVGGGSGKNSSDSHQKAEIGNLLNNSSSVKMAVAESVPVSVRVPETDGSEQKRCRSPPQQQTTGETAASTGTGQYEDEPDSQRRKH